MGGWGLKNTKTFRFAKTIGKAMVKIIFDSQVRGRTDFWRRTDDFFISMHAYARMKTVNAKGMNQGVVKYRYFLLPGLNNKINLNNYSRSYAEDVTSVTSGASQGPHSSNLVFVCLFVSRLALSRI